ncbi:hypothetical protein T265_10662 [Opisthorchis viverrini]|uniref:Uncharacterized protein n=1 Tax=Opisthorchis viverrini TaxID=6198 RepID=A0A074Z1L5_OPIVI|nr:hypothetical protein T265_10662 [Opisthorchis viverrini]KER20873.1 hypothetical protein T265_10662 [Opisthorchis viverrini]
MPVANAASRTRQNIQDVTAAYTIDEAMCKCSRLFFSALIYVVHFWCRYSREAHPTHDWGTLAGLASGRDLIGGKTGPNSQS